MLSRRLVLDYSGCKNDIPPVIHYSTEWIKKLYEAFEMQDVVVLSIPYLELNTVAYDLQSIVTKPIERNYYLTWPRIQKIQQNPESWQIEISLQEDGNG